MKAMLQVSDRPLRHFPKATPSLPMKPHKYLHSPLPLKNKLAPPKQLLRKNQVLSYSITINPTNDAESTRAFIQQMKTFPLSLSQSPIIKEFSVTVESSQRNLVFLELKALFKALSKLSKRTSILKLNISILKIGVLNSSLLSFISTSIARIKGLKACFFDINNIEYKMMTTLIQCLKRNPVKDITISYSGGIYNLKDKLVLFQELMYISCRSLNLMLNIDFDFLESEFAAIGACLARVRKLQSLRLKLDGLTKRKTPTSELTNHAFLMFFQYLRGLNLHALSTHFVTCSKMTEEGVLNVLRDVFMAAEYKFCKLVFEGYVLENHKRMLSILDALSQTNDQKNIQIKPTFSPSFSYSSKKIRPDQSEFMSPYQLIPSEISLNLDLPQSLPWKEYQEPVSQFSRLRNLGSFEFFHEEKNYKWGLWKNKAVNPITSSIETADSSLLHLTLSIDPFVFTTLEGFFELFEKFSHLQKLTLNFHFCPHQSADFFIQIAKQLGFFPILQDLTINLIDCPNLSDHVFAELNHALSNNNKLDSLSLKLESCEKVTDKSMTNLSSLIETLNLLKILNLTVLHCPSVTGKCLKQFARPLSQLKKLETLSLIFPKLPQTSNIDLENLVKGICNHTEIVNLRLDFSHCKISNEGLIALGKSPIGLRKLETLEICLASCLNLVDDGILSFGRSLQELQELKDLKINFKENENFTQNGQTQLINEIFEIKSLRFFTLDFGTQEDLFQFADVYLEFEKPGKRSINFKAPEGVLKERIEGFKKRFGDILKLYVIFK